MIQLLNTGSRDNLKQKIYQKLKTEPDGEKSCLAYDKETQTAHIPNEEIRLEFARSVREVKRDETIHRIRESEKLIYDTVHGNGKAVAAQIEKIHSEETSPLFYYRIPIRNSAV